MTAVLPTAIQYGTVTWRAVSAVADTSGDVDAYPDPVPVTGTLTFTPSASVLLAPGATPVTVIATPVTYDLGTDGVLRDAAGNIGIGLLATDSPGVTPTGWTWRVDYRLNNNLARGSFSFTLPAGTTVDLTTVAPVGTSGGAQIIQGPPGTDLTVSELVADATVKAAFGPFFVGKTGQKYRTLLGTLRNVGSAGGYWQPINDTAHHPTGIASVATSATDITVTYDFSGTAIGTLIAVTDETMASEGYLLGASVAANQCQIRLARRKSVADYISWNGSAFVSANGVFTVSSYTAGVLTLTHAPVVGALQNNCRLASRGGSFRPVVSTAGTPLDPTQTKVELWTAAGALATTGDTNMKFYVERYDAAGWLDPRTAIDTTTFPNHNIWLFGLHEV